MQLPYDLKICPLLIFGASGTYRHPWQTGRAPGDLTPRRCFTEMTRGTARPPAGILGQLQGDTVGNPGSIPRGPSGRRAIRRAACIALFLHNWRTTIEQQSANQKRLTP